MVTILIIHPSSGFTTIDHIKMKKTKKNIYIYIHVYIYIYVACVCSNHVLTYVRALHRGAGRAFHALAKIPRHQARSQRKEPLNPKPYLNPPQGR